MILGYTRIQEGCDRPARVRGYYNNHYINWWDRGKDGERINKYIAALAAGAILVGCSPDLPEYDPGISSG